MRPMLTPHEFPRSTNYKPPDWSISISAPLHNWCILSRPGWGAELQRNMWANALLSLLWMTQHTGLCGKVTPDGSDVWDRKHQRV